MQLLEVDRVDHGHGCRFSRWRAHVEEEEDRSDGVVACPPGDSLTGLAMQWDALNLHPDGDAKGLKGNPHGHSYRYCCIQIGWGRPEQGPLASLQVISDERSSRGGDLSMREGGEQCNAMG
ncbi:hypothetical protein TWF730_005141 [Orbilia blumenaviensis]|uniref:Uncharacterized protein n=1 Tax=Orbilia blumenaviensis TaxID=1796055 RepID=A0AAV9VHE5_9PEZI